VIAAAELYAAALTEHAVLRARENDGGEHPLPIERWMAPADAVDERVLTRARGPVLDVGCGPGRHVHLLAHRGVLALGVDISPAAIAVARRRGAHAIEADVFATIPGAGTWNCALLLDGNIGIGGDPVALLRRLRTLLTSGGDVLVETEPPGVASGRLRVRLEDGVRTSAWFAWARVGTDAIAALAAPAGLSCDERWDDEGRWFALLRA
jgi:SAM-dependent methyltransferase